MTGKIKKREFDARAVENSYDRTYKNECQRWRNIIHRAEKSEDTSPEQISKMKAAFEVFKSEALKRKTAVKNGQSSPKEFEDWILVQSSILYKTQPLKIFLFNGEASFTFSFRQSFFRLVF